MMGSLPPRWFPNVILPFTSWAICQKRETASTTREAVSFFNTYFFVVFREGFWPTDFCAAVFLATDF